MTLISWNCRGYNNKKYEIRSLINQHHPICLALQETHLKPTDITKIRGYTCHRKDNYSHHHAIGGVAIFISRNHPYTPITLQTNLQAIAIQIHIHHLITICTIYIPPKDTLNKQDFDHLLQQLPPPYIITGDFNAHSALWGNQNTNFRGEQIEDIISNNNLCILNTGEKTNFHEPTKTFHAADVSICSPLIFPFWTFWVGSDLLGSDHFPIHLQHSHQNTNRYKRIQRYIYDRADWPHFTSLATITKEIISDEITKAFDSITQTIIKAADLSIPKTAPYLYPKKNKPWWNSSCQDAKKKQQRAWNIFRRYPTTTNFIAFKKARAEARKVRRNSQHQSWIEYTSKLTHNTSSKDLWQRAKRIMGLYTEHHYSFIKKDGQTLTSDKNIANTIGESLATISNSDSYPEPFLSYKRQMEHTTLHFNSRHTYPYNCPFTFSELLSALKNTNLSSPGPDGVTYLMIKHLSRDSLLNLLEFYNRIWTEHTFPPAWHTSIIIPFPKPGKDPTDPNNYRPIALSSCICKLFERMVNARLVHFLENNNSLSVFQSGFRRGRSTIDNILYLETQIRTAFLRRNHLISVFFDLEKAYDKTWRFGILKDLYDLGLRGNLPIFIQNFLALRKFQVRIGSTLSDFYIQEEGVPQGSVLSVTLFSIKINNILHQLPPTVKGSLYVDDLQISCQGKDMRVIERQLQTAINQLLNWNNKNGFTFSPTKTSCIHFCRLRNFHPDPEIFIRAQQIAITDSTRFLGVIFDKKLTFQPHIQSVRTKCEKILNLMKFLSNTSWGADRTSLLRIYRAAIRSKIDYACQIYGSAPCTYLKKLDTVHHSALRISSGAFRTSPVNSLYVDCNEPPLYLTRNRLSIDLYYRILSHPNHPLHSALLNTDDDILYQNRPSCTPFFGLRVRNILQDYDVNSITVRSQPHHTIPPWESVKISCLHPFSNFDKQNTSSTVFQQLFHAHRSLYNNYIDIYTDGSKTINSVGCSFVCSHNTVSYKLPSLLSVFSSEIIAIEKALDHIATHHHKYFIIYSDSQSVLQTLLSDSCSATFHYILHQYENLIHKGYDIKFCWIPAHVGIQGNEQADAAAKNAQTFHNCSIPYHDLKHFSKQVIHKQWQDSWNVEINNKLHQLKPIISHWPENTPRKYDVLLTRLRIGHSRITHLHLLFGEPAPMCPHCHFSNLTISHILTSCTALRHLYRHYFHTSNPDLHTLIGETPHRFLLDFLKCSQFYHRI